MSEWIRNRKKTAGCPKKLIGKKIIARFRNGDVSTVPDAGELDWSVDGDIGDVLAYFIIEAEPAPIEPAATEKDPAKIAPKLWAAYKDVLNDEALEALRDVICEQWDKFGGRDSGRLTLSFKWGETDQGRSFWSDVYDGKYNKPTAALELQDVEICIPEPVNEVVHASIEDHAHHCSGEIGITGPVGPTVEIIEPSSETKWTCSDCNEIVSPFVGHKCKNEPESTKQSASSFLEAANNTIGQRGDDYDKPEGERSAEAVATAFNAITKRNLTEAEIWLVLQLVKDVRQWHNPKRFHYDSALDCVAYAALKAEALAK